MAFEGAARPAAHSNHATAPGGFPGRALRRVVEPIEATTDDSKSILDAIAANHATVVNLIDGSAQSTQAGFDRVEARLDRVEARLGRVEAADLETVKTDVRDLQSVAGRIETKLDRHETRFEALEARS